MTNKYTEKIFRIRCKGRDFHQQEVLEEAVKVKLKVYQHPDSNMISGMVDCKYNTGGHRQRCKASHPEVDKVGDGVSCPYSFDIPYAIDALLENLNELETD